jgi:hypothetical protein
VPRRPHRTHSQVPALQNFPKRRRGIQQGARHRFRRRHRVGQRPLDYGADTVKTTAEDQRRLTGADLVEFESAHDLSTAETATILGLAERTVRAYRGRRQLPQTIAISLRVLWSSSTRLCCPLLARWPAQAGPAGICGLEGMTYEIPTPVRAPRLLREICWLPSGLAEGIRGLPRESCDAITRRGRQPAHKAVERIALLRRLASQPRRPRYPRGMVE